MKEYCPIKFWIKADRSISLHSLVNVLLARAENLKLQTCVIINKWAKVIQRIKLLRYGIVQ